MSIDGSRRAFIGASAGALAGLLIAPEVRLVELASARPDGESAPSSVRWGMLIDTTRCADGCDDCVKACDSENALGSSIESRQRPQWIRKIDIKDVRTGRQHSLPMMCQHCANPPCVDVCPTGASFKRADGIVLVDRHSCIGCRYCMMACPYKARSFVHEVLVDQNSEVPRGKGCVEGCTLCVHRVDKGQAPACADACSKNGRGAILFGNLNDPDSEISRRIRTVATTQVRADLRLDPGVRYQGL
ncbi:MAG TPA: 4Fe-4S dicluster domain-containing protein [Rhodocyclaceae bacterium]|nr:4Fe-4S dicluster domain-containing protein [Rhodocyclaceae bacterium]HNC60300.1 4Fe-4S dicluster domain-containing protein [Rhodocyclaceae bacterium]HNH98089.1 4Fe-4S dicluster domain-containing protein [Rhodocyclaceae bacterium]